MALEDRLAHELIRTHPKRAAAVLERLDALETTRILARAPLKECISLLERLSPRRAAEALDGLGDGRATALLGELPLGMASRLARRLNSERLDVLLERLSKRTALGVRSLVRFPENSAGALMDPHALSLPEAFSVREALDLVRNSPESAGDVLYVLNSDQKLVGVLTLRELLRAKPRARLCDLMTREPRFIEASADRSAVISHPGWRQSHSLPVVDAEGCYIGAIDYHTLRRLEDLLRSTAGRDADTPLALGELFAAGAGGLFEALTASLGEGKGKY